MKDFKQYIFQLDTDDPKVIEKFKKRWEKCKDLTKFIPLEGIKISIRCRHCGQTIK